MRVRQVQQVDSNADAKQRLKADFFSRGETERPAANDLDVIIGETDRAERERRKDGEPEVSCPQVSPQQCRNYDRNDYQNTAHCGRAGLLLV